MTWTKALAAACEVGVMESLPYAGQRLAASPWLNVNLPTVDQTANDETTDPPKNENGNVFVSYDGVWKTNEQPEKQADNPTGTRRQLHAADNEADGEATRECAEQRGGLIGKRHRQHQPNIQRAEDQTRDKTKNDFGHISVLSGTSRAHNI